MKYSYFLKQFIIFIIIISFSIEQMEYFSDDYLQNDLIFPENDILDEFQYNLIEAKVLTNKLITLYLKKQGINLDRDNCCESLEDVDVWTNNMIEESQLEEIYTNAKYNIYSNEISYSFPVKRIEHKAYTVYHKLWIIDKNNGSPTCDIYLNSETGRICRYIS